MDKRTLGDRISRLRKEAGLSQDDLAGKSRIARRALQMIEAGQGNPTIDTLSAIAATLKKTFDELTGHTTRQALVESMAKQSQQDLNLLESARLLQAIAKASIPRRALIQALAHKNEKYLEGLPRELSQALREFSKAL